MNKKINFTPLFLLCFSYLLSFSSCSKEIEIDTRGFKQQIVVNSIFYPGKPFNFTLHSIIESNTFVVYKIFLFKNHDAT